MNRKIVRGSWYYVAYWDHSMGKAFDRIVLEHCGYVEDFDNTHIDFIWCACNSKLGDTEMTEQNVERYQMARSNIIKLQKLPIKPFKFPK